MGAHRLFGGHAGNGATDLRIIRNHGRFAWFYRQSIHRMPLRLLALLAFTSVLAAAEAPPTLLAQADKEIISDSLTKDGKAADWKVAKGKWERGTEGTRMEEIPADKHGAVSRVAQTLPDIILACDFRLDGAKAISLSINATKDHMARVSISPTNLRVQKDDHDHDGPDKAVIFWNTAQTFEVGTWHHIVLEMVGDTMVATIDGQISAFGSDPLFKTAKVSPGFTCGGQAATFRNFTLWSAKPEPKATWKEASGKIAAAMAAAPKPAAPAAKGKGKAKAAK